MTKHLTTAEYVSHRRPIARRANELPAPVIDEAVDGKLTLAALSKDLTFRIPPFEGMQPGDQFQAMMSSMDAAFGGQALVSESGEATFHVPAERALKLGEEALSTDPDVDCCMKPGRAGVPVRLLIRLHPPQGHQVRPPPRARSTAHMI